MCIQFLSIFTFSDESVNFGMLVEQIKHSL